MVRSRRDAVNRRPSPRERGPCTTAADRFELIVVNGALVAR
jgi:hypothetical protein